MRPLITLFWLTLAAFFAAAAFAQSDTEEKSSLITFVEDQLSTPDRRISLNGLRGTLSSNVELDSITIADEQGVWLRIVEPKLVWSRAALLTGRLSIDSLTAARIDYPRNAVPVEQAPSPEATSFALPDLPVSIVLRELDIAEVDIGETVFGTAARLSVKGNVSLASGTLDLDLDIERLDNPGSLTAKATFGGDPAELAMNVRLAEPQGGVIAGLLGLEGQPSVVLSVEGNGPVDDLETVLAFDVNEKRIVDGRLDLDRVDGVLQARARLNGPLADILPPDNRAFFGDESRIDADLAFQPDGRIIFDRVLVDSGATQLTANGATLSDGFLNTLNLDFRLMPTENERIALPGGDTSLASARLALTYDAERSGAFNAQIMAGDIRTADIGVGAVDITANGTITNPQLPAQRAMTFTMDGDVRELQTSDAALAQALGERFGLRARGDWKAGEAVRIQEASITGQTLSVNALGAVTLSDFDGKAELDISRLAAFASIAQRPELAGAAKLTLDGTIAFLSGAFDLAVNGTTRNLRIGEAQVDPLLTGETFLAGGVARSADGLRFKELSLANQQLDALLTGGFNSESADLDARARLADIGLILPANSGAASVTASVKGPAKPFAIETVVTMAQGRLSGRNVSGLRLSFVGNSDLESVNGTLDASGDIDGETIALDGTIAASAAQQSIEGLTASVGSTRLTGDARRFENGLINANLAISSRDIASAAALAALDASGSIRGTVKLEARDWQSQSGRADITASGLRYQNNRIGTADIEADFDDLFGNPRIDATIRATEIAAGGVTVTRLNGNAVTQGQSTRFDLEAALREHATRLQLAGSALQQDGRTSVDLDSLSVNSNITNALLQQPTRITLVDGTVDVQRTVLNVGGGSVVLEGRAGERLNLTVLLDALPLAIANSVRPELRAAGTLSGRILVGGSSSSPTAEFGLDGSGLSAAPLAAQGIAPLSLSANGRFADNIVNLTSLSTSNGQGIAVTASGRVPLEGAGLSVSANGSAPLAIAEPLLASRGTQLSGTARFDISAIGSLSDPRLSGLVSVNDGTVLDPLSNLRLTNIGVLAGLNGDRIDLRTARGDLSSGGSVEAAGSILLDAGLTADIAIRLQGAQYTDGETFLTRANGQLRISGQLTRDPLLSGQVDLAKTEIAVPESLAGSSQLLEVRHVRPSQKTVQTLQRIERVTPKGSPTSRPSVLRLDVTVNAPNQIFVRGRGLDAELGGRVRVTGPVTTVVPVGQFELRRGRISIVGQRIDLDEGKITLTGDLDPLLSFVARTRSDTVEAIITIEGRASDLDVSFSSEPELPQDEVLAQVIFGRSVGELSPVQIARLASIAAELTGGNSPGLVDQIRSGTGLDDLDVTTDSDGNAAVQAGKYLTDDVYLGVQTGAETKATINLDITDTITARGAVGTDGESSLGIFLERDY
ncbi:MAG: translocation/assembly module TamB domain-containing protein [Ahrensia sp.]|nr:translocation/assembly module TamB domain-containing protein [Ahrensia sp.]